MTGSNIKLSSELSISSSNVEEFYRDYWIPGRSDEPANAAVASRRDFIISNLLGDRAKGHNILEIGVGGEGGIIKSLAAFSKVHGVDVSDSAIASCRFLGIPVTQTNCDRSPLPFDAESFDAVIALEVFEHFSNPQFVLEEIRRVLKPCGLLIASIPSPYTYHWPRLFYPELFTQASFKDFLLANRFSPLQIDDPFFMNTYKDHPALSSAERSFSMYWQAEKIPDDDTEILYTNAKQLFERRDHHGIRIRPIEALELFRHCYEKSDSAPLELMADYMSSLLYRFINGDTEEFLRLFSILTQQILTEDSKGNLARTILKVNSEAELLGISFLEPDILQALNALRTHP